MTNFCQFSSCASLLKHVLNSRAAFIFNIFHMINCNLKTIYIIVTAIYSPPVFLKPSDITTEGCRGRGGVMGPDFPTVAQTWQFLSYPTSFSPIQGLFAHGKPITCTHTDSHALLIHTQHTRALGPPGNGFCWKQEIWKVRVRERKAYQYKTKCLSNPPSLDWEVWFSDVCI